MALIKCTKCGQMFSDKASACPNCGCPNQQFTESKSSTTMENYNKPDNNLLWAILSTIFCCLPLGIVSIINAAKVDNLYMSGDKQGAQDAADKAKKYALFAAICGSVGWIIYIILWLVLGGFMAYTNY